MERESRMPVYRLLSVRRLFTASAMFTLGCLIVSAFHPSRVVIIAGFAAALLSAVITAFVKREAVLACIMALCLFAGAARYDLASVIPKVENAYNAEVIGELRTDGAYQPEKARTVFDIVNVTVDGRKHPGGMRVYLPGKAEAVSGDTMRMTAHVWQQQKSDNPNEYDFASSLWTDGISACCKPSEFEITGHNASLTSLFASAKRAISSKIDECVPDNAALLKSLMLADRTEIETETRDAFSATGTAHILAVSGLHVSALALLLDGILMLTMLPQAVVFAVVAVAMLAYMHIIGCPPPVTRAVIGYIMMRYAKLRGYPSDPFTRLGTAALIMLLINPLLISSVSFLMSFMCVFVLLCLSRYAAGITRDTDRTLIRKTVETITIGLISFAAQLPLASNVFGRVSPIGIVLNIPAIPLAVAGLYTGIISVLTGSLFAPAGVFIGRFADMILTALTRLVSFAGKLPFANMSVPRWPYYVTAAFVALIAMLSPLSAAKKRTKRVLACALIVVALIPFGIDKLPGSPLKCVFLNVGQANCAAVYAGNDIYLVDTGDDSYALTSYLSKTNGRLKGIFITHAHSDHMEALRDVLEIYRPQAVYLPLGWRAYGDVEEDEIALIDGIPDDIPVIELESGDSMELARGVTMKVYAPEAGTVYSDANDGSMMLLFEPKNGDGILFTGDVSIAAEPNEMPDCDVIAVPHHGAFTSLGDRMLQTATPGAAVISVGENNYGHPSGIVLSRLERYGVSVYRTDENGAVTAEYGRNGKLRIYSETGD